MGPPTLPILPSNTRGPIFLTAVLAIGFGVGTGIAFLLSQVSPMLFRSEQLQMYMTYPVMGVVTHLEKDKITKINNKKVLVFALSSSLLVIIYIILVVIDLL